jgi:hypothetical protein
MAAFNLMLDEAASQPGDSDPSSFRIAEYVL